MTIKKFLQETPADRHLSPQLEQDWDSGGTGAVTYSPDYYTL